MHQRHGTTRVPAARSNVTPAAGAESRVYDIEAINSGAVDIVHHLQVHLSEDLIVVDVLTIPGYSKACALSPATDEGEERLRAVGYRYTLNVVVEIDPGNSNDGNIIVQVSSVEATVHSNGSGCDSGATREESYGSEDRGNFSTLVGSIPPAVSCCHQASICKYRGPAH